MLEGRTIRGRYMVKRGRCQDRERSGSNPLRRTKKEPNQRMLIRLCA
jgi:hypothetical protein